MRIVRVACLAVFIAALTALGAVRSSNVIQTQAQAITAIELGTVQLASIPADNRDQRAPGGTRSRLASSFDMRQGHLARGSLTPPFSTGPPLGDLVLAAFGIETAQAYGTTILAQPVPGTLLQNVQIPDTVHGGFHVQLVDIYVPNVHIAAAIVALHGGSGSKENFARNLFVANATPITKYTVNWGLLEAFHVMAVFPQGQFANGVAGPWNPYGVTATNSTTWSNHVMWSGQDDIAFLADLKTYVLAMGYGTIGFDVIGHSNGGMEAERIWYEAPTTFAHYCAISGPASDFYILNPAVPSPARPFWIQLGLQDDVLDITGGPDGAGSHFYSAEWTQNPAQYSEADTSYNPTTPPFFFPVHWIGESYQAATRANAMCSAGITQITAGAGVLTDMTATKGGIKNPDGSDGTKTSWDECSGSIHTELLSAATHTPVSHYQAAGTLPLIDCLKWDVAH